MKLTKLMVKETVVQFSCKYNFILFYVFMSQHYYIFIFIAYLLTSHVIV